MRKHILIVGPPASGKTTKALEIIGRKAYLDLVAESSAYDLRQQLAAHAFAPYALVEGIDPQQLMLPEFKALLTASKLRIKRLSGATDVVSVPRFIFTANGRFCPSDDFLKRHLELITLPPRL